MGLRHRPRFARPLNVDERNRRRRPCSCGRRSHRRRLWRRHWIGATRVEKLGPSEVRGYDPHRPEEAFAGASRARTSIHSTFFGRGASRQTEPSSMWAGIVMVSVMSGASVAMQNTTVTAIEGKTPPDGLVVVEVPEKAQLPVPQDLAGEPSPRWPSRRRRFGPGFRRGWCAVGSGCSDRGRWRFASRSP